LNSVNRSALHYPSLAYSTIGCSNAFEVGVVMQNRCFVPDSGRGGQQVDDPDSSTLARLEERSLQVDGEVADLGSKWQKLEVTSEPADDPGMVCRTACGETCL
jgi:hypothetical protein